jgi:nucleoside-diphosphate-sugar epimerase
MTQKRILVTGASGCIGHYLAEALIQETTHDLYLLVRNPNKLQIDTQVRPGVTVLQGDMQEITRFADLLKTVDIAVLTATAWGGTQTFDINVARTLELLELLEPNKCEQVIYFSTASVLGNDNQPLKEAGEIGHDYVRSKYDCLHRLSKLAIAPKITTVFPTIVLGGDLNKPYSAVTSGIPDVTKYIDLIRFFKADGSFHFIHAQDIATVVRYLIDHPPQNDESRRIVLGQAQVTANQVIEEICAYLDKKIYFRIPLSLSIANLIIFLFRIQMADWDRFCMNYRHFTYQNVVNPAIFGLPSYCVTIADVLRICEVEENAKIKINHSPSKLAP